MVLLLFGLVLLAIVGGGVALTKKPISVRWFERGVRPHTWTADQIDATLGYRDAPVAEPAVVVAVPVVTAPSQLPAAIRVAASGCRISFILGLVSILPTLLGVLYEVVSEGPAAACVLGPLGLALSFAHLKARRALLGRPQEAASLVATVGVFTMLYNACVAALMIYVTVREPTGDWRLYALNWWGSGFIVAYVGASLALGVYLLKAWRVVRTELDLCVAA